MRTRVVLVLALVLSLVAIWSLGCESSQRGFASLSTSSSRDESQTSDTYTDSRWFELPEEGEAGATPSTKWDSGRHMFRYLVGDAGGEDTSHGFRRRGQNPVLPDIPIIGNAFADAERAATETERPPFSTSISPADELWVISRFDAGARGPVTDDAPGSGSLVVLNPSAGEDGRLPKPSAEIPIPLEHTAIEARIDAYIAGVRVTQTFINPFDEKIEAVYVFPLPQDAAVDGFVMTVGERRIRGIIREREEAERIYADAKRQGHRAALMTQERPNIFTQSVANIEPGKSIGVDITYFHTLPYRDGWFEYTFPMVVGPRFNPPCPPDEQADGVGAVARGNPGASNQDTEVQYLRPGERSGHDVSLSVALDAGVSIEAIDCPTHEVSITRDPNLREAGVTLSQSDSIPNRDFILRYRVSGSDVKTAVITHADPRHVEDGAFSPCSLCRRTISRA